MTGMADYQIQNADLSLSREIAEIEAQTFSRPWSQASIEAEINDESAVFLACVSDERVVGYVSAKLLCPECYIGNLAVRDGCRRQGIGAALLKTLIDTATENGCNFLSLEVRVSNATAIRLYERSGFRMIGIRKNYYSEPTEDAAIYTLFLYDGIST